LFSTVDFDFDLDENKLRREEDLEAFELTDAVSEGDVDLDIMINGKYFQICQNIAIQFLSWKRIV